ncbi:uncharacterized protein [Paramisgurnus dabryanus]|uniref:uncharacterized protein n=1 Tax=Paramisgurnus dabryanus TaxID=90735 RepID=UPI0031F3E119
MHFHPMRCFTGFIKNADSMAWNPTLKQRLQVTNQRGFPPLETIPVNQHGSSSPNTGLNSNTMLQGRSLKDSRQRSEKTSRKSFTARKAFLIACGVRCVLSPRPTNCSTSSSPNKDEKERPRSSPARGERVEREMEGWSAYSGIKRTDKRERARSSIQRERAPVDLTHRPSTVPLEKQMRRRAISIPDIPTCKILWRRKDDQSFLQDDPQHSAEDKSLDLTPSLHLYLPSSYHPEPLLGEQNNGLDVHDRQAVTLTGEVKEHNIATDRPIQNQDITVNSINEEWQNDFTDGLQYDVTDTRRHNNPVGNPQPGMTDTQHESPKENFENDIIEGKSEGITDDNRKHEVADNSIAQVNQCDITDVGESYTEDGQQKSSNTYKRTRSNIHNRTAYLRVNTSNSKLTDKTRYPAPATALTFSYSLMDRNPCPTVSVLPSFYGISFGFGIKTFNTSEPRSSKTRTRKVYNDIRFMRPMDDVQNIIETKGNSFSLQTKAGGVISPRPKIMSTERRTPPHKIKTTKTFLWGPDGPQETKTVCELQSHLNRWRSSV